MGFRDPLEAAQSRIAQLTARVGELLRAQAEWQIERENLEAELQVHRLEAGRKIVMLEQQHKVDEVRLRSQSEAKVLVLERRLAELEAELEGARATIAQLEGRPRNR